MSELLIGGALALAAGIAGAWIFAKGQKVGADIVWRVVAEDKPPLFDKRSPDIIAATTEEMDADAQDAEDDLLE